MPRERQRFQLGTLQLEVAVRDDDALFGSIELPDGGLISVGLEDELAVRRFLRLGLLLEKLGPYVTVKEPGGK